MGAGKIRRISSEARPAIKSYHGKSFLFLNDPNQLQRVSSQDYNAIVLQDDYLIGTIRKDDDAYLKPLFIVGERLKLVDGAFEERKVLDLVSKIEKIERELEVFNQPLPHNAEEKILVKTLRFLLSRKVDLEPISTRQSGIGYNYHFLEDVCLGYKPSQMLRLMDQFTSQEYFQASLIDKVNLCHHCDGSYLNFSECCVKCHSLDLKTENLIHHFRCAYIGPESDFQRDGHLVCPKCDKTLKHIGIDYDKPSEVHTCGSCNHSTQETVMRARCVDCGQDNKLDQLTTYKVSKYKATEIGYAKATEVVQVQESRSVDSAIDLDPVMPSQIFNLLSQHEIQKRDLYKDDIYHLELTINPAIISSLNQGLQQKLLIELAGIVKPYLKVHDLIALHKTEAIQLLLIDYDQNLAQEMESTLAYNLNKMLMDNQWSKKQAVFSSLKLAQ